MTATELIFMKLMPPVKNTYPKSHENLKNGLATDTK